MGAQGGRRVNGGACPHGFQKSLGVFSGFGGLLGVFLSNYIKVDTRYNTYKDMFKIYISGHHSRAV